MSPEPLLVIQVEPSADGIFLHVQGELDMSCTDVLLGPLAAAERDGYAVITLDLEGLKFMDSSGLGICIAASRRAAAGGWTLNIVNSTSAVRRVFDVSGLTVLLSESDRVGLPGKLAL